MDENVLRKTILSSIFYVGGTYKMSKYGHVNIEIGIQNRQMYAAFQVLVPLTRNTARNERARHSAYKKYQKMYDAAIAIDRYLNPDKFSSGDGGDSGGGDSGGGGGGGGDGCGGND